MTAINEGYYHSEFIVSEANGARSREKITIASGQNLRAGEVLGKVTENGHYKQYNPGNDDGSETAVAVLLEAVDASDGAKDGAAIVRDAEVNTNEIQWFTDATAEQKATGIASLANVGIIAR